MTQAGNGGVQVLRSAGPRCLAGLFHRITCFDARDPGAAGDREMASFVVPVILSFAHPFSIAFDSPATPAAPIGSFVSGLHPGFVDIAYGGPVSCVQIDLTPIGARLFFGRPMSDFATRLVPLEDVGDRGLTDLRDRLGAAGSRSDRLGIATEFVAGRLLGRTAAAETAFVWSAIERSRGDLRIDRLARDLGWSRKRLAAHARDAFGLTPKLLARIARFRHAIDRATGGARPDWAGLAIDCGYADQAHLVRDFTAFAGAPPGKWRRTAGEPPEEQIFNTEGSVPP